jgi:hypothetical protein
MRMRRAAALFAGGFVLAAPATSNSNVIGDVIGFPIKLLLGSTIDKAQGNLDASVSKALQGADVKLRVHEDHIADLATALVDHTNDSLTARITQVTTNFKDIVNTDLRNTIDHAIGQVGGVGAALIDRLDNKATKLVDKVDDKLAQRLQQTDEILKNRSTDINKMLDDRVSQTNLAIKERVIQIDEVARGRLGDVNAIANQQRIALEGMIARIAVLVGAVVFLIFVMKALFAKYQSLEPKTVKQRGARRTAFFAVQLAPALAGPLLAAFCGLALLGALYRWLPAGALQAEADLVAQHQGALTDSVRRLEAPRARYEAAHLSYLDPQNAAHYAGLAAKAGLIRDVVVIPGLLATEASRAEFRLHVSDAERALGPRPDPDLLTLRAMDKWKTGATRQAEHEAASLAARALELAPRGFGLAPLARAYVETFLNQPFVAADAEESRDLAALDQLAAALALATPEPVDSPFASVTELSRLMRALEKESTDAYVALANANARAVLAASELANKQGKAAAAKKIASAHTDAATVTRELQARTKSANDVVAAWKRFDKALQANDRITGAVLLNVFGLNDAPLTRALWFVKNPQDTAAHGITLRQVKEPTDRIQLAPARVAWALRYGELMSPEVRAFLEAEEAKQFENWERWAIELEDSLIALEQVAAAKQADAPARWRVAVAAAALGLYVQTPSYRAPYALTVAGDVTASPLPASTGPLARKQTGTQAAAAPPPITDAPTTLEALLNVRGQRLI